MEDLIIKFENVSKQYRLGMIGRTTFKEELQRFGARIRHKEDPTSKIGRVGPEALGLKNGDRFYALQDIDLTVRRGETLGIIGRNGAGKSTLLKLLCRITAPTEGTISYNGRIASMLEVGTGFHPELTGRENIYLNGAILGMSRKEIDAKIGSIIEFSECGPFIDTPVKRYSSGMYVKLAFSVAAFLDAEIMIMDEVLAVGDAAFQKKSLARMKELAEQEHRTVLYVSHLLPTVTELCTRTIVLDRGRIQYDGPTADAVSFYLDNMRNARASIEYSESTELRKLARRTVRFLSAAFEGKDRPIFFDGEPMLLKLRVLNLGDNTGVSFRLEIRTAEGRPVAVSLKEHFLSGKAGREQTVVLRYDLGVLAEGRYDTSFYFYYDRGDGSDIIVGSEEGLSFEKRLLRTEGVLLNKPSWGNVRLAPPETERIE